MYNNDLNTLVDGGKSQSRQLYLKVQKVRLKKNNTDIVVRSLCISVTLNSTSDTIKVTITDEHDPFLLYSCSINHDLYKKIKHKLGLLVDFSQFPDHFTRLLTLCCCENSTEHTNRTSLLLEEDILEENVLSLTNGVPCFLLKVMEINNFQQLCLIALRMHIGSDKDVTAHIASNMLLYKSQLASAEKSIKINEDKIGRLENERSRRLDEMETLRSENDSKILTAKEEFTMKLLEERKNSERIKLDYEEKIRQILSDNEQKHNRFVAALENELQKCKDENDRTRTFASKLETDVTQKDEKINRMQNDIRLLQDEILNSENKISKLDDECRSKQIYVTNLKHRLTEIETALEEKSKTVEKITSLLDAAELSKVQLKSSIKELSANLNKREKDFEHVDKDLRKANDIIGKLNAQVVKIIGKLNIRTKIVLEQEKIIKQQKSRLNEFEQDAKSKDDQIKELQNDNCDLRNANATMKHELALKDEIVRKNEKIIKWLNEALSQASGGDKLTGDSYTIPSSVIVTSAAPLRNDVVGSRETVKETTNSGTNRTKPILSNGTNETVNSSKQPLSKTASYLLEKYSNIKTCSTRNS